MLSAWFPLRLSMLPSSFGLFVVLLDLFRMLPLFLALLLPCISSDPGKQTQNADADDSKYSHRAISVHFSTSQFYFRIPKIPGTG